MSEQDLYSQMLASMEKFQGQLCATLREYQNESREAIKRIHERIDAQIAKEAISRESCEDYRSKCGAKMCGKIKESTGYPPWLSWTITGTISLLAVLIMYVTTGR